MKRNIARTVALTLAFAFLISVIPTATVKQAQAAGWTANTWTIPLVDDWGKSLAKNEARGYLYNSTGRSWENWDLLSWGDVWVNDTGSYITFKNLRNTWNNTNFGQTITYSLVIKLKVDGKLTPITIYNRTILTIVSSYTGTPPDYYYEVFALKDLGEMLQFGEDGYGPVTPIVDDMSDPLEVWLYYKAFKLVDQQDLPVTVSDVEVYYSSSWENNWTWITTAHMTGVMMDEYWTGVTNGTYDPPTNGLIPVQNPFGYEADCKVGWAVVKLPIIDGPRGSDKVSLVNNMTFLFYYHGTLVANFTAIDSTPPAGNAWLPGTDIIGTFGPDWDPVTEDAVFEYNTTEWVYCNIEWAEFPLWDQEDNPWPTRNAKITLYDVDEDSKYPWPGVISPDWTDGPSIVLLRYPMVNHTLKIVVTWFDNTVNVTYIKSPDGGFDLEDALEDGLKVDMVLVWIKVFTSTQVPAPLDPNWVDEVKIRIESRVAPYTTYIAKLSYWHGYIILPDTPFGWYGGMGDLPGAEYIFGMGWLPSGNWSTIDFFIKYKGLEVVNTVTKYPVNGSLKLVCPGTPSDYGKTFILYAGVYDVGFKVLLGDRSNNESAPEYTPLFITTPDKQRILVTTDGQGVVTLRDVPLGTYKDFTILFKMLPINCSNVKSVTVNGSTKPLIELLFPVYHVKITVWNFEKDFMLINLNVSLYNTVDYSKYGIDNDLLRRALDIEHKRSIVFPDGWVVLDPVWAEAPGDLSTLIDYLGDHPMDYAKIKYRTEYWLSGMPLDDDGCPTWPTDLGLMPAANYSCRVSVQNGTQNAVDTGFRPADYNATVYWSEDPYPGVGPIEVSSRTAKNMTVSVDICTYIYNVPVQTLDASEQALNLIEHSAIILAEPYDLVLANDVDLDPTYKPRQLWYMQQYDEEITDTYNAYLVRFNSSDRNVFHSINASSLEDSPMPDPDLNTNASYYPQQSRYLIGKSTLEPAGDYRFNVYYRGVLVFNESIALENPYSIGVPAHSVTGVHKLKTSVYPYVFEAINSPLDGSTFGIANLKVEVFWAGLNTSWWPTVNLTYRTAAEEFALLNASKHFKCFNMTVVKRQWGNVTGLETQESITYALYIHPKAPYYSSYVQVVNGTTDSWGEFKCLVPVWNYSIGTFPTLMNADYVNIPAIHGESAMGGPKNPWSELTDSVNLAFNRTTSIFGTPVFVNYTTIPGKTQDVPALDDPRLAGVAPGYEPWVDFKCLNATGLINPDTVEDLGGVSLTMDELGVRFNGIGVLTNNTLNASYPIVYGDFQGRSPELAHTATRPYKEEGKSVAPPQAVANFFAKVDSPTLANDLWVWVEDYAGNALAYQRVEVIRANYTYTKDEDEIVVQPELLTVQYTPRVYPYGPVKIASTPTKILWGFYPIIVRTTNLTAVEVDGTNVVPGTDKTIEEMKNLQLYGHQWLYKYLEGGDIDWESQALHLRWQAKLDVQIKAGDKNTPIEKAWVFLSYGTNWAHTHGVGYFPEDLTDDPAYGLPTGCIDWGVWEIGQNVTAGLTDSVGFAASLKVADARGPLATSLGTALNLGFNVYRDVYVVKVYYKYAGATKIYGPVEGIVVFDSTTDQPQHRYVYLTYPLEPPETGLGEDYSVAQKKDYDARVWDLKLTITDLSLAKRPISGASVDVKDIEEAESKEDGSVSFKMIPGGKYDVVVKWQSMYNPSPVTISRSTITLERTIDQPLEVTVYDAELQLISPTGRPISNAEVSLAGVPLGLTGADGKVLATQVPSKYTEDTQAYPVTATWYGENISPGSVTITSSKTYILTASHVAPLTVQVVGAQGQGLNAAQVEITKGDVTVFSGVTNEQGVVSQEVPYGTYNIRADYKGFVQTGSATVSSPTGTVQTLATNVFIEVLGQAMTFATFILWIIVIIIVVLVLAVVVHEYHVWRRKRLPQLFGAPRVPGA